jgi:predicted double-glycine peptidase
VADWEDEHLKEEYLAYLADLEKNRISVDKNSQGNNVIVQTNSQGQINGFRLIDLG